jgi:dihydroorotase-like cyclic amidohydrolase
VAVKNAAVVDYAFFGGVSGRSFDESIDRSMEELAPDVVGFKCYFISGMDSFTRLNHYQFAKAIEKAAHMDRPLLVHAEDYEYVAAATAELKNTRTDNAAEWEDYVLSRPEIAETTACASALALAAAHAKYLHVVHVGTPGAARLLHAGGASCETCPHYLEFSSADFSRLGSALKTAPPVKSPDSAGELWRLLSDGTIAFCASDHAPAPAYEKHTGNIWSDYGGIPGTGTIIPYLFSEGYSKGRLALSRFLKVIAEAQAKRYGLEARKGRIGLGMDADFFLLDPESTFIVQGSRLLSKGTITPFEGMRLKGKIKQTYVRGALVYDSDTEDRGKTGIVVEPGYGRFTRWGCN